MVADTEKLTRDAIWDWSRGISSAFLSTTGPSQKENCLFINESIKDGDNDILPVPERGRPYI